MSTPLRQGREGLDATLGGRPDPPLASKETRLLGLFPPQKYQKHMFFYGIFTLKEYPKMYIDTSMVSVVPNRSFRDFW